MFHIKICGIRQISDVDAAATSGVDAVGLNFFPGSVRYLDPQNAATKQLSNAAAGSQLIRVGVFVNEMADRIAAIRNAVGIDAIQLHGDEQPELAVSLRAEMGLPVVRAIKLPADVEGHELDTGSIWRIAQPWVQAGCHLILDADAGLAHGGSGKTLDWHSIRSWATEHPNVTWTLAGGLSPTNVAEAIEISGARSVDAASGVESSRGVKSSDLIRRFAEQYRKSVG